MRRTAPALICLIVLSCGQRSLPAGDVVSERDSGATSDQFVCPPSQLTCRDVGGNTLECVCQTPQPDAGGIPSLPPPVVSPPVPWWCDSTNTYCKQTHDAGDNRGLPDGGTDFRCHLAPDAGQERWVCYGVAPAGVSPGGYGWSCVKVASVNTPKGGGRYRCERPDSAAERPPRPGHWVCTKSTINGHECWKIDSAAVAPGNTPAPCKPGQRMWCDGLSYSSWGSVSCDPTTGKWAAKTIKGKQVLDCQELQEDRRPDTLCACYSFFFNPTCCERKDCIIPVKSSGAMGQVCSASAGKLCDHCNPLKPECVESGAICLTTNANESFCGRDCSGGGACPAGYGCTKVKMKSGETFQCVPADFSCYY